MQLQSLSQPFAPRDVSVFVSSTFRDMHEERDALRDVVLPRLREELRPWAISADLVDLRWGVDTSSTPEAEHDAKVLKVCFSEIERCEPFFLALLGDRYGYVPDGEGSSVTEQEIERALSLPKMRNRMICCLRTIGNRDELSPALRAEFLDPEHEEGMAALRAKLRARGVGAVVDYAVRVAPDGKYDLSTFTEAVAEALISQVRQTLQFTNWYSYRWTISISMPSLSNMSFTSLRMLLVFPMGRGLPLSASTFMGRRLWTPIKLVSDVSATLTIVNIKMHPQAAGWGSIH